MSMPLALLGAYLLGSVPTGFWVSRWVAGIDIQEHGSRNVGATNVFRVVGKKWGLLVLAVDFFKGYLAVRLFAPQVGAGELPDVRAFAVAFAVIAGHTWTFWLRFRGGKGVATSAGVLLGLLPGVLLAALGIFGAVFGATRVISISSLSAAAAIPAVVWVVYRARPGLALAASITGLLALFIFWTHRANIRRLLRGEEKKLF